MKAAIPYIRVYGKGDKERIVPLTHGAQNSCHKLVPGTELELVSRILGHSSTETTRIYAVPSVEMMRKTMETGILATGEETDWLGDEAELARLCGLRIKYHENKPVMIKIFDTPDRSPNITAAVQIRFDIRYHLLQHL
ncbi:MAG: hypothetical protein LIP16_11865 [Clostridium sp.]|nr:hypothetical protein [Clostridium sp.]